MSQVHRRMTHIGLVLVLWLTLASAASAQTMRVHFINVGQGAATLVEFPCAAMLIDTGGEFNVQFDGVVKLEAYLEDFFFRRPDLNRTLHSLIITHPHIDHTRGIPRVLDRYRILNAVTNGQEHEDVGGPEQVILHRRIAEGEMTTHDPTDDIGFVVAEVNKIPGKTGLTNEVIDPVKCSNVDPKITVLWGALADKPAAWSAEAFRDENNHSVVTRIDFGASSLLITGDLEIEGIEALLAHHGSDSKLFDTDVYMVGHHGSRNGTNEELLRAVTPKIAAIAMGPHDRRDDFTAWQHGHPRQVIVDLVEQHVSQTRDSVTVQVATGQREFEPKTLTKAIYATGWDGSVVLEADTAGTWKSIKPRMGPAPQLVDINKAGMAELSRLGIGQARAEAIVARRLSKGSYGTVNELNAEQLVGPATFLAIRSMLTTGQ